MPNHAALTDAFLRTAKPPTVGTTTVWDGTLKHFGVRISQGGAKSFIILIGSGRRQTIGRFPIISIAQARTKARALLAERTLGRHQPKTISWDTARDQFLEATRRTTRPRTHQEYARTLKRYFPFGPQRLVEVTKADINRRLDKLADVPSQQNHALVIAKIFFNWAIKRGYCDTNPCLASVPNKTVTRARVLTDDELKRVWIAAGQIEGHFGTIVKLLILTGQRRGEIAALRSDYISNDTCTLPSELTKNGREHLFPIGSYANSLLSTLGTTSKSSADFIFAARGSNGTKSFNGWSKSKRALDELSSVNDWTLHDIRRTFATRLAELGVAPHVIERLLNHVTGSLSPLALVYNRATFLSEMRAAIDLWESKVRALCGIDGH